MHDHQDDYYSFYVDDVGRMTPWHGIAFNITGPLWGESIEHLWDMPIAAPSNDEINVSTSVYAAYGNSLSNGNVPLASGIIPYYAYFL